MKRDSIEKVNNKLFIRGYSAGPPQYGIELNYYQLDSIGLKNYIKMKKYYDSSIDNLKNSGVKAEKISKHKNDLYKTLSPPLNQLYVNESFLKNNDLFEFYGSLQSYEELKIHLEKFEKVFIMLPYNAQSLYDYKYHLIQVKKRYIAPGL